MLKQHLWLLSFLILLADSFSDIGHFYCGYQASLWLAINSSACTNAE